jgi:excisionase family DNA binding protein
MKVALLNDKRPVNLMTKTDLSKKLKASLRTISRWMSEGRLPPPRYIGRTPRWRESEIDQWIDDGCPPSHDLV